MRSLLRTLLWLPMVAALLTFAAPRFERSTEGAVRIHRLEVGFFEPWLRYRSESTHDSKTEFDLAVADDLRRAAEAGPGVHEGSFRSHAERSWSFQPLTWSMLAGLVAAVAAVARWRLGRPRRRGRAAAA